MSFSKEIKQKALIACKRHCVLCECEKGVNIECHHIVPKSKGGEDTFDNCIPLCFECHSTVEAYNSEHPKGNKYTSEELKIRRDLFYKSVEEGLFPKHVVNVDNCYEDGIVYQSIKNFFQSNNLKYYLTEFDLGNDFDNRIFYPLNELVDHINDPDYKFVDYEIEEYKNRLFLSVNKFLNYKANHTFSTNFGTQAICTWKNDSYSEEERLTINMEFNELATSVWNSYEDFISACKRKL